MVLWMGRPSKPMSSNLPRRACLPVTLSSWTTCRAIRSRVYAKLSPRRGPTSAISRLTAQISILSSSSLPSSRRCSGRRPRELSMTCSRQSPMLSPSSPHRNAPTMSQTAAIATQPENALVEKNALYRCLDKVLAHKHDLFGHLRRRWQDLFGARFDVLLYDLTSTYFESDPPAD